MTDINMPQLGETVTEGTITRWFKQVGDEVAEDEPLFEVSTDKVDSEVPASISGRLAEILVQEGETVDVGVKLAVITEADGDTTASAAPASEKAPEPAPAQPSPPPPPPQAPRAESTSSNGQSAAPAPASRRASSTTPSAGDTSVLLSPVVRRLLDEHNLDPAQITGTGQGGRITRSDVLARIDQGASRRVTAPAAAPARPAGPATRPSPPRPAPLAAPAGVDDVVVPFSNIRRRTAEHMIRSQATSAHVLVTVEVDFSNVESVRLAEREAWRASEGFSLTYLPFISRAAIDAIEDYPHVNASVGDNELIVHRRVHLGIAVDLNFDGLIVPVVHDADQMRLRALARSFADLAGRARSKDLTTDEVTGSTFTITNPGPFGTHLTFPVINQPQVAILSTDGIRKRPVAVELPDGSDAVAVHPVGMVGMAFDHRAFDGAYASAFMSRIREILETRDWTQEI